LSRFFEVHAELLVTTIIVNLGVISHVLHSILGILLTLHEAGHDVLGLLL
jgi:hypothetical protein